MTNWQTKKLGDAMEFIPTGSHSRNDMMSGLSADKNAVFNIHYGDIHTKYTTYVDFDKDIVPILKENSVRSSMELQDGDLVVADASEDYAGVGSAVELRNVSERKVIGGLHTFALRSKNAEFAPGFTGLMLKNPATHKRLMQMSVYSKVYGLTKSSIASVDVSYPEKPEQQRIVGVLEVWGEYIDKLEQKIALKEQLKKGLMQQLLTGKRRLPGFSDEWQMVPVGSIACITMGQSPSSSSYNDMGDGMVLVQGNADMKNGKTIERIWTTEITKKAPINSLIMTVRAPVGEIAVSNQEVCLGRGVCSISSAYSEYLRIYLTWFKPRWSKLIQGSTFESVNGSDIRNLKISIPGEKEANTIADTFKSAEANIELLRLVKESATQQKKYLLKNLITGTIRTPEDLKPLDTSRLERSAL